MSVIGGIIGAAGSIVGGMQAASAQKKAAKVQRQQFQETKASLQPYMGAGEKAIGMYGDSVGLNGADAQKNFFNNFESDPGWQASEDYATRGIENLNSIRGRGAVGGNIIAGLGDYLQKNKLDAFKTRQSQIGGLVDTGKSAATALGGIGQASAAGQASSLANAGYYSGAGFQNAANSFNAGVNNAQMMNMYKTALGGGTGLSGAGNFFG